MDEIAENVIEPPRGATCELTKEVTTRTWVIGLQLAMTYHICVREESLVEVDQVNQLKFRQHEIHFIRS